MQGILFSLYSLADPVARPRGISLAIHLPGNGVFIYSQGNEYSQAGIVAIDFILGVNLYIFEKPQHSRYTDIK